MKIKHHGETMTSEEFQEQANAYFLKLRDSGRVNMMAAPGMIQRDWGITHKEAVDLFWEWTQSLK